MSEIPKYALRTGEVHEHLAKQGLTVSDLATEIGVTPSAAYRWLKADRHLNPRTRQRLMRSKALRRLPFDQMFERVEGDGT